MSIDNGVTWEEQAEQLEADIAGTAIARQDAPKEGVLWSVSESIIATAKKETALLKINGVTDLVGYEAVKKAKWKFTKFRTGVEAVKKKMNEEAQRQIKKNGADAKLLLDLIEPEEDRLQGLLRDIDVEVAKAKQAAEDELFDLRRSKLTEAAGAYPQFITLSETATRMMTETEFDSELVMVRTRAENQAVIDEAAEKARAETERRNADEAKRLKSEAEKLAAERAEIDRQNAATRADMERQQAEARAEMEKQRTELAALKAEQDARQRAIDEETQRMTRERVAKERSEEIDRERVAAAEKARIETEQRIAREAAELARAIEIDAANKVRAEALRPDREKLASVADVIASVTIPDVESDAAKDAAEDIGQVLASAEAQIRRIADRVA